VIGDLPARFRDTVLRWLTLAAGAGLLLFGILYLALLAPIVNETLVVIATVGFLAMSVVSVRALAARHEPLDPARPSTAVLRALIDRLADQTGVPRPGVTMDDSTQGRTLPNVGAVEMGPATETLIVTEQFVADVEAGRLDVELLRGVLLHELGHLAYDHSLMRLWLGLGERLVRTAALLGVFGLAFVPGALALVGREPAVGLALALGPLAVSVVVGAIARAQEIQADAFAVRHAAGRELSGFFHWMQAELGPVFDYQRDGIPHDPAARAAMRDGLARLVDQAVADGDRERQAFFGQLVARLDARTAEDEPGRSPVDRAVQMAGRLARQLVIAWVGAVRWTRSHPDVDERLVRIAAEMGTATLPAD
jgi:Zn-dependent protease with chaperone function